MTANTRREFLQAASLVGALPALGLERAARGLYHLLTSASPDEDYTTRDHVRAIGMHVHHALVDALGDQSGGVTVSHTDFNSSDMFVAGYSGDHQGLDVAVYSPHIGSRRISVHGAHRTRHPREYAQIVHELEDRGYDVRTGRRNDMIDVFL